MRPCTLSQTTPQFLETPEFRNVTLKCLSEIAALSVGPEYDPKFVVLFAMVMTSINRMIPPSTSQFLEPLICGVHLTHYYRYRRGLRVVG